MLKFNVTKIYLNKVFKEPVYYTLISAYTKELPKVGYLSLKDYVKFFKNDLKNNKTRIITVCIAYNNRKKEKTITIRLD